MPQMSPMLWLYMFFLTLLVVHLFMCLTPSISSSPLKQNHSLLSHTTRPTNWLW